MQKRYLVIGTSAAALGAITKVRQLDTNAHITCVSDEVEMPYNKCLLADFLARKRQENSVHTITPEVAAQKNIQLMLGVRVEGINPSAKSVICSRGPLFYDSLLIATGSSPVVPHIEGIKGPGVFTFHSLADTNAMSQYIAGNRVQKVVVIGAGLSGLECADALACNGLEVTIIEKESRVLAHQIDKSASMLIERAMVASGITTHMNNQVVCIMRDGNRVVGVQLKSGNSIEASLVIYATGLRANDQLARDAGIECGTWGIRVDATMQTSKESIFAAGDAVMVPDQITRTLVRSCTWPDAMQQGMVAALAMTGTPKSYQGALPIVSSSFFGLKFASYGPVCERDPAYEYHSFESDIQSTLVATRDGVVRGFSLAGDIGMMGPLKRAMLTNMPNPLI